MSRPKSDDPKDVIRLRRSLIAELRRRAERRGQSVDDYLRDAFAQGDSDRAARETKP